MSGIPTVFCSRPRESYQPLLVLSRRFPYGGPMTSTAAARLASELENELRSNILPFWMTVPVDPKGGFFGEVSNDLRVTRDAPRAGILCARILWTFSSAYRRFGEKSYLRMAHRAYDTLISIFIDPEHGGVYWTVDSSGRPVDDRKHHYTQAFAIYGLTEYHRAVSDPAALGLAGELYRLLEQHARDRQHGGYVEGSSRSWGALSDMRLSERDLNARKSMNTMLHVIESYSNLLRVWENAELRESHRQVIELFLDQVLRRDHLGLFFDDEWNLLSPGYSFGHELEAGWLLVDAARLHQDPALARRTQETAVLLADGALSQGMDQDGGIYYEGRPDGIANHSKAWWVQAEAMVGFQNAYEISGDHRFADAVFRSWEFIKRRLIDRDHGDWFKELYRDGTPDPARPKVSIWDCPYHHGRTCMEMIDRLNRR
jgi:mannobiose 2-epimerase